MNNSQVFLCSLTSLGLPIYVIKLGCLRKVLPLCAKLPFLCSSAGGTESTGSRLLFLPLVLRPVGSFTYTIAFATVASGGT